MYRIASVLMAGLILSINPAEGPQWVGKGKFRLLVRVDPADLGSRRIDEMPARITLSAAEIRRQTGAPGRIDVSSIQVARYAPATGRASRYAKWAYAQTEWEVPFRWYDSSIPEDFPEFDGNIDRTNGELRYTNYRAWGYFYETLGEWESGHLAWTHTQEGKAPSYYAIYFDLLPEGVKPDVVPRRGYLGDGYERVTEIGPSTHGMRTCRIEAADWNGDGLMDLLVGGERGGLVWFPNRGSKTEPRFPYPKMIFLADGRPLDVGFSSAPLVLDWDGDGVQDLLSGAEWNRIIWYKNVGSNATPKLEYQGFVLADGQPLRIPHEPNPEIKGIYKTDYHPVPAVADWDGDGDLDLFAGGYVTGRIFYFENTGRDQKNLPALRFRGAVEADGKPVDTQWSAAPCLADFDGDGDPDLISGSMAMTAAGGDSASSENYLYYFENIGNARTPRLTRKAFPVRGRFHRGSLAAPRAADLNGDGLLDLVLGETTNLRIFKNVGTRRAPLWEYVAQPLEGRWNTAVVWGQPIDWNNDGNFDLVQGFSVSLNQGKGNPQLFGPAESFLPKGETIFHKSPTGDQWTFTQVCDLDSDGQNDIVYGVHEGHVYFHRNLSDKNRKHFDTAGVLIKKPDGKPIKVGPESGQSWDFDVLQGSRTTITSADYDRDGKLDLVVGDAYGKVRFYRNATGGPNPQMAEPTVIAGEGGPQGSPDAVASYVVPTTADWNSDGWPDVLIGYHSGQVFLALNAGKAQGVQFLPARKMDVPRVPFGSTVMALDWNGDSDVDLLNLASYGYLCWYDRSFLDHGYATATIEKLETQR